jgi:CRP/FNR family transcriptional regulator, dissimilatory nitrate respiration regulator
MLRVFNIPEIIMPVYQKLCNHELFRGIDRLALRHLLEEISYRYDQYEKNQIIVMEGESLSGQLILLRGSVRAEMVNHTGKTIKIEDIESGRLLAPAFLFAKQHIYPVSLIANEYSETVYFIKRAFLRILQLNETVLNNYLEIISGRAYFLSEKIKFLAMQTIREKTACYLLELAKRAGSDTFKLTASQAKMAELFGVTRPALTRVLRDLHENCVIRIDGKRIHLPDKKKLSKLLQ